MPAAYATRAATPEDAPAIALIYNQGIEDRVAGSVSTCARWRIPVVVGYAAARFGG
jgi:hypothetical protein